MQRIERASRRTAAGPIADGRFAGDRAALPPAAMGSGPFAPTRSGLHLVRLRALAAVVALCAVPLVTVVGQVSAADLLAAPAEPIDAEAFDDRWNTAFGAYVWAASLSGSVGAGGLPPSDVNASFADILENLDLALMAVGEVRYSRFGVSSDFIYTRLSADGSGPAGFVDSDFTNELVVATLMGQFRAAERERSSVDLMAGARLWNVSADLTLTGPGGGTASAGFEETWVDPMAGVKGRLQGSSPWYATGWGMVGGFGVSSDFAWDVLGAVGYEVRDWFSFVAGYRAFGVDYQDDGFVFDVIQHGPVISGVLRF